MSVEEETCHVGSSGYKLITLVIPGHKSLEILDGLVKEKFITTGNKTNARGMSANVESGDTEMEVLTVVVDGDLAEDTFNYLYNKAELHEPHSGIIYQTALTKITEYTL
ncbi:MAG: hypothetical protein OIF32_08595 [Campylobacterales bacterium]|nr:hypothetical protein [Campylobacterales bacterium]